jgi:hypothetical protein
MAGHRRAEATPFFEQLCPAIFLAVIACDKREAFAQGSVSDEAIQPLEKVWIASLDRNESWLNQRTRHPEARA